MKNLLETAVGEIGVKSIPGDKHNERILAYAKEGGFTWIKDDETAWCSIFLNWAAKKSGFETSKSGAARSWLNVGMIINDPEPGDIVIFWRNSPTSHFGHVGIFMGVSLNGSRVYVLGGNQGNSVSISAYPKERVLGYRRLRALDSNLIAVPQKVLKKGDKGILVSQLQDALKSIGINPGTSDGHFGSRTESAVKELQTRNTDLEIDGVFNTKTRAYLSTLINNN